MATIEQVYNLWANLDYDKIVDDSIKENESQIIDAQIDQMKHGIASDGEIIGKYATTPGGGFSEYAKMKATQNNLPGLGNVDLILDGNFTHGIEIKYETEGLIPFSTDAKNDELVHNYGERIFGLSTKWLAPINQDYILPSFQNNLKHAVGL